VAIEKVLHAILFVFSEGCTWRGIDGPDVAWNTVYQYYRRWCRDGVWAKVWEQVMPVRKPTPGVYGDSSFIKVHRSGLNAAGGRDLQAIGKTKGGWNTKLHAAVDGHGSPVALILTGGEVADVSKAEELLSDVDATMAVLDKGYDSDPLRAWLVAHEMIPCIPPRSNRTEPRPYRKRSYRKRHLIENFFSHLKTFRRVATRYDKLAETFFGWVLLAVLVKFGK
jgi:transposase